jgi:SAM-dependent methyltransferase
VRSGASPSCGAGPPEGACALKRPTVVVRVSDDSSLSNRGAMKNEYVFERNRQEQELLRLRMIEEALDPATMTHLQAAGIRGGWRCLEVGAGAGSVMEWMGSVVGGGGQVVAVDANTTHIRHLSAVPYHVVEGDFLDVSLDGEFDLAHCRYVLIHNRRSQDMLKKLCALTRPGGFLVIEEPDFTSAKLLNHAADPSQQRVNNAICRMFEQMRLDPAFGLGLPRKMAGEGLRVLRVDSRIHLRRGGDPMAHMMGESTRALRDQYIGTGEANAGDVEKYIDNANNDRFWAVYYSTVSVVAEKTVCL